MRILLLLSTFLISYNGFAQQPKVSVAAKADTSSNIHEMKVDTHETLWKNKVVENHFLYSNDSLRNDSIEPKNMKAIKRKERKYKKN